jgi:peroxiredoxin Q/BCP
MAAKKTTKKTVKKVAKKSVKKVATKPAKTAAKKATKKAVKKTVKKSAPKNIKKAAPKIKASAARPMMPAVGSLAPEFALQSDAHGLVSLSKYRGSNIVLYFYPKDDTPGCTREACSFQEHKNKLLDANAVVIGVSPDSVVSHGKFRTKYGLDFVLIADEERKVCKDYGVWVEKNNYGKKYMGVQRATFLIDRNGCISYVWPKVSVDGHTEEVLEVLSRQ